MVKTIAKPVQVKILKTLSTSEKKGDVITTSEWRARRLVRHNKARYRKAGDEWPTE